MAEFNVRTDMLTLLRTRRSGKPRDMVPPGPGLAELKELVAIATRVPDHGKLSPWRFLIIPDDGRGRLADLLVDALLKEKPGAADWEQQNARDFANQAPALVIVLSSPKPTGPIPRWEQELSAGAACMNLLVAAHAMGYVAGWLTGWAAYSSHVRDALGGKPGESIAGFIFIGSPGRPLEERPRPALDDVVTVWQG
jgi:nitroreductase